MPDIDDFFGNQDEYKDDYSEIFEHTKFIFCTCETLFFSLRCRSKIRCLV